jgi:ABC-type multidrug transport system ATPase subunit
MHFKIRDLNFGYGSSGNNTLKNISLTIDSGLVTGLAGANGSGKTTLIKILLGQLIRFDGTYTIDDVHVSDRFGEILYKYNIGYAPDDVVLDDYLTGYEILEIAASLKNVTREQLKTDMDIFTQSLQIEEWFMLKRCGTYSTGMRRKTALCLAFLGEKKFHVLDEPTNGLDPLSVRGLKRIINEKKSGGAGTLVSSHILDFIEKTSDDCILLSKGDISYKGSMEKLKQTHNGAALEDIYFSLFTR